MNSMLTRHVSEAAAVKAVADRLTQWGHDVKVSTTDKQVILVTSALPRTLRKARAAQPKDMVGFVAMLAASVKEKTK